MKKFVYILKRLKDEDSTAQLRFLNYKNAQRFGGVKLSNYFSAAGGTIRAANEEAACEKLYWLYNRDERPAGYTGRSMSVSDIVELWDNSEAEPTKTIWYCDSIGFQQIDEAGNKI